MTRRVVYAGRIVNLGLEEATLPDGRTVTLEVVRHPGAAAVVPIHADGTVTLVYQHRHAGGGMHYELPAGVLDPGERPEDCAARELAEEVQLAAGTLSPLGAIYTTPGFTDERIWLYLATELAPAPGEPDDDEFLTAVRLPLRDALQMTRDGAITDAKTICGLHLAVARLEAATRTV